MLGLKLIHVSKRGPWRPVYNGQIFADNACKYIKKCVEQAVFESRYDQVH